MSHRQTKSRRIIDAANQILAPTGEPPVPTPILASNFKVRKWVKREVKLGKMRIPSWISEEPVSEDLQSAHKQALHTARSQLKAGRGGSFKRTRASANIDAQHDGDQPRFLSLDDIQTPSSHKKQTDYTPQTDETPGQ